MRRKKPPPGPENMFYTNAYAKKRERIIGFLKKCKQLNAARRAEKSTPGPMPEPRLDATPVRLSVPQKMPHLRRACDDEE